MKAYPLIYSRTKNFDFVPDFLARPKDLEWQTALSYVKNAMSDLDFLGGIRYTVFSTDKYCVCGGVSGISSRLLDIVKRTTGASSDLYGAEEYLRDCKGRNVACFIGIAIPKSGMTGSTIPNLTLKKYWDIYLEYLKHQWEENIETKSEQIDFPPLEITEKEYQQGYIPNLKPVGSRYAITDFNSHPQEILDYFFSQVLSGKKQSLITEINSVTAWENLSFTTASVPEGLYKKLEAPAPKPAPESSMSGDKDEFDQIISTQKNKNRESGYERPRVEAEKKTTQTGGPPSKGIFLVAALCILFLIFILAKCNR